MGWMLRSLVIGVMSMSCGMAMGADSSDLLAGKDLEMAKEMNEAYARHVYATTCIDVQKAYFMPKMLSEDEVNKRLKGFKQSCECMSDNLMEKASPNDIIGYVTSTNGTRKRGVAGAEKMPAKPNDVPFNKTQAYKNIAKMTRDKDVRKKCGFSQ